MLESIEREGLLNAGKEGPFFKALGLGRELAAPNRKAKGQWWAPAYLVRFNRYMIEYGLSPKMRVKAMRCYLDNKAPPPRIADALAGYTEELLIRR